MSVSNRRNEHVQTPQWPAVNAGFTRKVLYNPRWILERIGKAFGDHSVDEVR
jgi:hypothetical protein